MQDHLSNPPETPEGEWLHKATHDYSPHTGAVAACRTCGWGEHGTSASWGKHAAQKHRERFGRVVPEPEPVVEPLPEGERRVVPEPTDAPGKPGRKPTHGHGTVAHYNRGCRCEACTAAKAAYKKSRRSAQGWRRA